MSSGEKNPRTIAKDLALIVAEYMWNMQGRALRVVMHYTNSMGDVRCIFWYLGGLGIYREYT